MSRQTFDKREAREHREKQQDKEARQFRDEPMSTEPGQQESEFLPRLRIPKIPDEDTKGDFLPRLRYPKFPDDPPQPEPCPECDGQGFTVVPDKDGEPEQVQCRACWEREQPPHPEPQRCENCDWTFGCFDGSEPCQKKPVQPHPEPQQSAVEWVGQCMAKLIRITAVHEGVQDGEFCQALPEMFALELAQRCDEWRQHSERLAKMLAKTLIERSVAKNQLALEQDNARQSREEIEVLKGEIAASQAEAARLREALGWYAGEVRFCNSMSREGDESRDRLAKDRGNRAIDALAKKEGER